ncbi:cold-shock protein, partial [Aliivibrio sp. S2MY1]
SLPDIGDKVEFESKPGAKGPRANNIRITAKLPKSVRNHNQTDDRINCPSCKKKIVPRMITYKGEPDKSVCPYCAATVSTFGNSFSFYITVIAVIAFIVMIW